MRAYLVLIGALAVLKTTQSTSASCTYYTVCGFAHRIDSSLRVSVVLTRMLTVIRRMLPR
jgi:hypothetical protein